MRNKISRYEENQVDRFLYDLYLLWGGNLDEDMCITGWGNKNNYHKKR